MTKRPRLANDHYRRPWCEHWRAPQIVLPQRGKSCGWHAGGRCNASAIAAKSENGRKPKATSTAGKPAAPRFSKDWFNQQLGRPYVLYPLCAVILLGALWFSFGLNSGRCRRSQVRSP